MVSKPKVKIEIKAENGLDIKESRFGGEATGSTRVPTEPTLTSVASSKYSGVRVGTCRTSQLRPRVVRISLRTSCLLMLLDFSTLKSSWVCTTEALGGSSRYT